MNESKLCRIRVLPPEIAEKIAAGEVIERPASVLKELVENSIDSGATHIQIQIEDGGKRKIQVSDNGIGIHPLDLPLALERHATSKINALDDLWNLHTMGFRGEALPSISTISRFTIKSKTDDSKTGRFLYLEGGKTCRDEKTYDSTSGTTVVVEDLFYNVPARLKFQKTKTGESVFIRDMIEHFALCHPHLGFTLISEGRKTFDVKPEFTQTTNAGSQMLSLETEDQLAALKNRMAKVLEAKPEALEEFHANYQNIHVFGFLDRNQRASNSKQIYLCVNRRIVKDKLLQQAVISSLRNRMMEGEYPRIFLCVEVQASDVDVNVHPTKSEVRFRNSRDVFQIVYGALTKLAEQPSQAFYDVNLPETLASAQTQFRTDQTGRPSFSFQTMTTSNEPQFEQQSLLQDSNIQFKKKTTELFRKAVEDSHRSIFLNQGSNNSGDLVSLTSDLAPKTTRFGNLDYIGQLKNTYLLFQNADGLILIDQHAAHERINYEKIKDTYLAIGVTAQPLLISITVKVKGEDLNLIEEYKDFFARLGFETEEFGDDVILLRSIPEFLNAQTSQELFIALLNELKDTESSEVLKKDPSKLSPKLERILATSACHSSVRAGQSLSREEAYGLLESMDDTRFSLNCPHGRPASIRLTYSQIENLFKR